VSFLLDTNVLSELRKGPQAHENVRTWDRANGRSARFTSTMVIAELRKGALARSRKDPQGGAALDAWVSRTIGVFGERVLPVDLHVAEIWARLMVPRSRPPVDTLIAATALAHGLTLVTRNLSDFKDTGVALLDPWAFSN
jgi:predicted nucleic acid-binding protein